MPRSRFAAALAAAASLAAGPPARAQDPHVTTLPPLVVEESPLVPDHELGNDDAREALRAVPGSVALVDDERIARTRAFDLEDALALVPGVFARARGFGEEPQLSIRGSGLRGNFHTRGVDVLLERSGRSARWMRGAALFTDSANRERAPAYALLDLRLGVDHEPSGVGVFFEARNLTDRDYASALVVDSADGRAYEPGDGRSFTGGVSWRW